MYKATLSSAIDYAAEGKLEEWIHLFLQNEGKNRAFSDGLYKTQRIYIPPALYPIDWFVRCSGPEEDMEYPVEPIGFYREVKELEEAILNGVDLPPLIVNFSKGIFTLNDGNHRHKAYENLEIKQVWAIVWVTGDEDYREFTESWGWSCNLWIESHVSHGDGSADL